MNSDRRTTTPRPRQGITLLEVLISIGVVGIGLIGVAALIPLAHHKAAQGVREDRKALMGRRAFREFRVRGMDRPGDFVAGTNPYWVQRGMRGEPLPYINIYGRGLTNRIIPKAYCLDPLGVAEFAVVSETDRAVSHFPEEGDFFVDRLTLLAARPEVMRLTENAAAVNNKIDYKVPTIFMSPGQAGEIFRLRDELVFEQPDDKKQPIFQVYLDQNKRLDAGAYSWMATLVPQTLSGHWTLSVVVFHRRDIRRSPRQVVVAEAQTRDGLTLGAKDIRVRESNQPSYRDTSVPLNINDVGVRHIKNGDWIMLMQRRLFGVVPSYDLKWYRVAASNELVTEQETERELVLTGPDWATLPPPEPLYAVYLKNVVAVYEKTIRLHGSSMYTR